MILRDFSYKGNFFSSLKEKTDGDMISVLAVKNSVLSMFSSSSSVKHSAAADLPRSIRRH